MVSMAARGSMGLVQNGEGRTALVASKLTAIACRWGIPGQRDFHGYVQLCAYCSHSSLPFSFSLAVGLPFLGCSILVHGQDASKTDHFSLPSADIIQGVGRRVPLAPISRKYSTPSPLPGQLTKFALLQVC